MKRLKDIDNNLKFIFIGDHGMQDVIHHIDVESKIISYDKET